MNKVYTYFYKKIITNIDHIIIMSIESGKFVKRLDKS